MLTLIKLVDEALGQAGLDSSYRAKGRNWLNIALDRLANRYNYRFYRTSVDVPFVALQKDYNLPADFKRVDTVFYIDANGSQGSQISIREPYEAEPYQQDTAFGIPNIGWIDDQADKIKFSSAPAAVTGEKYRLHYFSDSPSYDTTGSDDSTIPAFDDQWLLMEEIKALAYEWQDDERYPMKKQEAAQANQEFQRNMYQSDAFSRIPLNNELFRSTVRRRRR